MKKIAPVFIWLLFAIACQARIITVDDDGPADFNNIQAAIFDAVHGDIIEVQPGIYTGDGNRDIDFQGKAITVRSIDPNDPNIVAATIIDCNGSAAQAHRGLYFHNYEDANSIIDGISIINGYENRGGGICCEESSPTVTNCIITGNTAQNNGGGLCSCLPIFIPPPPGEPIPECNFPGPIITNCTISENSAQSGGGVFCEASGPAIANCTISNNTAPSGGGICFSLPTSIPPPGVPIPEYNIPSPTLTDCTFEGNWASKGGGICTLNISKVILKNCIFTGNLANSGGGIYNKYGRLLLTNCTFNSNSAGYTNGGGICCIDSEPIITNCTFTNNSAEYANGGGIFCIYSEPIITNCTFTNNMAHVAGGGLCCNCLPSQPPHSTPPPPNTTLHTINEQFVLEVLSDSNISGPLITKCIFNENSAIYGGGICSSIDNTSLINCILRKNSAQNSGGGIHTFEINLRSNNCTFSRNLAPAGKSLSCKSYFEPCSVYILNCILWYGDNEIWHDDNSIITINYSDIQGGWAGEGNIDVEPCFVDEANGNYRLLPDSPCIDTGDPNYVTEPNDTDLDGRPRVINGRIDMGAYEYISSISAWMDIEPNTLNLTSKGKWITAFIWLPEEYNVADIDPNSVFLEGKIKPERFLLAEDEQVAIAKFDRGEAQSILDIGEVELTINGQLTDGTIFEAQDTIKAIDKGGGKPVKKH